MDRENKTAEVSKSAGTDCSGAKTITDGTWFQSAISGMWYECDCRAAEAAGDVGQIMIDGKPFVPLKDLV